MKTPQCEARAYLVQTSLHVLSQPKSKRLSNYCLYESGSIRIYYGLSYSHANSLGKSIYGFKGRIFIFHFLSCRLNVKSLSLYLKFTNWLWRQHHLIVYLVPVFGKMSNEWFKGQLHPVVETGEVLLYRESEICSWIFNNLNSKELKREGRGLLSKLRWLRLFWKRASIPDKPK